MSENTKKMLSLLMAVSMVLSMMPMGVSAQGQTASEQTAPETTVSDLEPMTDTLSEIPLQSEESEIVLELGVEQDVVITEANARVCFSFTPVESGVYHISSAAEHATLGYLYDSNWNYLQTGYGYSYEGNSFQVFQTMEAGTTYYLEACYWSDVTGTFRVLVERSPLQSITFTPISVIEGTNGYVQNDWNPETQTYDLEYYYYNEWALMQKSTYTATFTDGMVLTGSGDYFEYNGNTYNFGYYGSQGYYDPWTAGNTYSMNVSVMGIETQFSVTITASPLQSITFTPVSVAENTNGYIYREWNPETQTDDLEYYYYEEWKLLEKSTYTATFTDGTVVTGNGYSFTYNGVNYEMSYSAEQGYAKQWTVGNTYYIDISIMGQNVQVPVTITTLPLESLTFTPVTIMEGTNGNSTTEDDTEYFRYSEWNLLYKSTYTATFTDGTVITNCTDGFTYDGEWYSFDCTSNQSATNQWTPGNTYCVDITVAGKTYQIPVSITASPLQSITFTPITVIEGSCGSMQSEWNPDTGNYDLEYFYYQPWELLQKSNYTATFTDGTTQGGSGSSSIYYDGEWYSFQYTHDQGYDNQWTVGNTYYIGVSVLGQTVQVPVTIVPSPVVSFTVEPVTIIEGKSWRDKLSYTVTFEDGTRVSESYGNGFDYNEERYSLNLSDGQIDEDQWTAGNTYTATAYVMGVSAPVSVTVVETPVANVTFDPIIIEEHEDGYWYWYNDTQYYRYYWSDKLTYTVTFKDGTVMLGDRYNSVRYNGENYGISSPSDNQGGENPWLVDNTYTAEVLFEGKWYEVYISVCSSTEDNGYEYIVQDGKAIITGCTTTGEILDIPETIDGYPVVGISSLGEAIKYALELRIPDSVTMLSANILRVEGYYSYQKLPLKKLALGSGIASFDMKMMTQAANLEWIEVAKENLYLCSIDGVVYNKAVTILLAYPPMKQQQHIVPDSVTDVSNLFVYNYYLELDQLNVQLGAGVKDYKMVDGIIYNADMTTVIQCTSSATGNYIMPESVTEIAGYAFADSKLTTISISPNVTNIVYTVFGNCTNLKELTIPQSVKSLSIGGCPNLEKLHITDLAAWCSTSIGSNPLASGCDLYLNGEKIVDLVIPNVVEWVYSNVFHGGNFESVTIPNTVKSIGYGAFANCENLERVYITDLAAWCNISYNGGYGANPLESAGDLYLNSEKIVDLVIPDTVKTISSQAFKGGSFESVTIPASVTAIGSEAFVDCAELKKVCITDLAAWCNIAFSDESANPVNYVNDLYLNGELITNLVIPEGVQSIGAYAFFNGSMTSVTVPSTVTEIAYWAFAGASIESISLAEGVQSIGSGAFERSALKSVDLPDSLTYLGYRAFSDCAALESVDIGSGLRFIEEKAFYKTGLKSVTIPKQVTDIYSSAFASSALTQVHFDCDAVSLWGGVFQNCPLGDLEFGDNIKQMEAYDFNNIQATQIKLPPSVTYLSYRTFAFNTNLVSVTIPDTMEYIDSSAFEGDRNLSHVLYTGTQDQWDALDVQSVELNQATLHCEAVGDEVTTEQTCATIRFFCTICDKWETVKKLNASHTFVDGVCTVCGQEGNWEYVVDKAAGSVTITGYVGNDNSVIIPDELDGLPVTAFTAGIFAYNNKLISVTIPGTIAEVPAEAFRNCKSLECVTVENGVKAIGSYAFYDCWNLRTVTLPETVSTIGEHAFYKNIALRNFQIPEGVTEIGESAFFECYSLKNVVIPEGVTEICYNTFGNCYGLNEIQLPETLITIGKDAFAGHRLKDLEIPASVETIGESAFWSGDGAFETVTFQGATPAMENAFEGKFVAFYEAGLAGWEEYLANYDGDITWYASGAPEIRVQPEDVTVESGSTATVSAEAYGHRLSYQWYYAPYGSDTFTEVGGNSIELSMVMDAKNPNCRAYCVISDVLGRTTTTETVTLKIDAEPTGIRIAQLPYTVEYDLRQALRTDGLEVVLVYSDLTETPINDYEISGYDPNVGGEQVVTVSFGSHTAYFTVAVNEEQLNFADKQEGVEISAPVEALDSDTVLVVETVEIEENVQEVPEFFEDKVTMSFDITLQKDEQPVQPRDKVKVSIPVPKNMRGKRCRIYHVDEHGNIEDMNALLVGAYLEFYTTHFSVYSVVEMPGYTVSGNVATPAGTQAVTVKLLRDGNVVQSLQTSTGAYSFDDVMDGSYTLEVNADGGKVRSYAIIVEGTAVYQNLSIVEHTVTFQDWDERVIASEKYFEGSLVTAPADPVRQNDRTYSYTFTGWDKKVVPCTEDAVYTATYSYSYLNDGGSITVGSTVVGVGEQFVIPVSVSDNLGIAGLKHTLTFDATALKLISVEFQGDFVQGTPVVNDGKADEGLLTVLWFSDNDVASDGVIYNLTFEVLETATNKKSEITIAFNEDGNANIAGENVIFDAVNGTVEVRTYWLGDLNGDRECKMVDLLMLAQYAADFEMELTENQLLSADVDEDGDINIHDVILLNQWLLEQDK